MGPVVNLESKASDETDIEGGGAGSALGKASVLERSGESGMKDMVIGSFGLVSQVSFGKSTTHPVDSDRFVSRTNGANGLRGVTSRGPVQAFGSSIRLVDALCFVIAGREGLWVR